MERDREEDLQNLTHKGAPNLTTRVFRTLATERQIVKAIALVVNHLHKKNLLTDNEIDDLLLEAAGPPNYY